MAKRDLESEVKNSKNGGFFVFCMILYVGCIISYFVFDTYCIKDHINGDRPISHKATDQKKQNFYHLWMHQVACDQLGTGRGTREERPKHSPASAQRVGFFNIGSGRVLDKIPGSGSSSGRVGVSKYTIGYFRVCQVFLGISGFTNAF